MSDVTEHCAWEGRLQDRIDGDLDPTQSLALDKHLAGCLSCCARMHALYALDAALSETLSSEALGESFDRKVLEHIAETARADRAAARARLQREWQAQMADLSHQWRVEWGSLALNVLAGATVLV